MAEPKVPLQQLGSSGLVQYQGDVDEEYLYDLRGANGRRIYSEMEQSDPTVGAIMYAILTVVQQVTWTLNPADDSEEAENIATFVEECRVDMSNTWEEFVGEALSMLTYGWSYFEKLYKYREGPGDDPTRNSAFDDGKIGWRKFAFRSQDTLERWEIDADGSIRGMHQRVSPTKVVFIPIEKALLFRTWTRKNNPEGRSILRTAYRPWYLKKNIENIESIGIERDLAGLPVFFVPADYLLDSASPDQKALVTRLTEIARKVRADEMAGLVLPVHFDANGHQDFDFKLLSSGGAKTYDVDKVINRYDKRIAMTVLADFVLLGQDAVGSYALSDNKTAFFALAVAYFLDRIRDVFNKYAIPQLLKLNGMPVELAPELTHGDIETRDVLLVADYLSKLHAMGAPIAFDTDFMRFLFKLAGLPEPPDVVEEPPAELEGIDPAELDNPSPAATAPQPGSDQPGEPEVSQASEPRVFHLPGEHNQKLHGGTGDLGIGPLDNVDLAKGHAITTGKNKAELRAALVDAGLDGNYLDTLSSKDQYEVLKSLKKTTPEDLAKARAELGGGSPKPEAPKPEAPKPEAPKPEAPADDFSTAKSQLISNGVAPTTIGKLDPSEMDPDFDDSSIAELGKQLGYAGVKDKELSQMTLDKRQAVYHAIKGRSAADMKAIAKTKAGAPVKAEAAHVPTASQAKSVNLPPAFAGDRVSAFRKLADEDAKLASEYSGLDALSFASPTLAAKSNAMTRMGEIATRRGQLNMEARDLLRTPDSAAISMKVEKGKASNGMLASEQFLSSVTSKSSPAASTNAFVEVSGAHPTSFDQATKTMRIKPNDPPSAVSHEFGHAVEQANPAVRTKVTEFYERRTATGSTSTLFASSHPSGTKVKDGGFVHPYVGKRYKSGMTEVLSVGFEYLHREPLRFAAADPEHFNLVMSVLQPDVGWES